jgi:hypothetical protein
MEYLTAGNLNLQGRGIHPQVIGSAPIGMVPEGYDPEPIIGKVRKQVADSYTAPIKPIKGRTYPTKEEILGNLEQEFATPLRYICKDRAGWMVFFYQDAAENYVSANFRKLTPDEDGHKVVRMWLPLKRRGVFHPFVGGYTYDDRVLVTEGEFNQLQYLSAYARVHGDGWRDEAYCCVTVGAATGVDTSAMWGALSAMECEDEKLLPVVCEDGDKAGKEVTHAIAQGGFTHHFTLPKNDRKLPQDLDEYITRLGDDPAALKKVEELATGSEIACRPMPEVKEELDSIRANGEKSPRHVLDQQIYEFVTHDLQTRAEMYLRLDDPYLYIRETHKLIKVEEGSPEMERLLRGYGLLLTENDTALALDNLISYMKEHAKQVDVHKLGCILPVKGADEYTCYVNRGDGQLYKITEEGITTIDNGMDDVFCLEDGLIPWPKMVGENREYAKKLDETLGVYGLKVMDTPLCRHYRALYEERQLNQEQSEQLAFTRFMLHWLGNSVSINPVSVNIGIQNSGKSTQFEKLGRLLYGRGYTGSNLPPDNRSLVAGITNSAMTLYDNVDSADFSKGQQAGFLDTFCQCATGGMASQAQLYANNHERRYDLRNHLKLTSRCDPFKRPDAMRRTIQLEIRKPRQDEWVNKDELMDSLMLDRDKCLIEVLIRLQHIVCAYNKPKVKHTMVSEMPEYEDWTYRLAAHEGWYPQMRAIWVAHQQAYNETIAESNPLVMLIKLWLGQPTSKDSNGFDSNVGKHVSTSTLWVEVDKITRRLGLKQTYTSAAGFGKHLTKNMSELLTLGFRTNSESGGAKRVWFNPSEEQIKEAQELYRDLMAGSSSRGLGGVDCVTRSDMDDLDGIDERKAKATRWEQAAEGDVIN